MILLCEGCNELKNFFEDVKLMDNYHPYHVGDCKECGEVVFEVDELIAPTIIELNKKGWTTEFCCSGHLETPRINTYISFKHEPKRVPHGFFSYGNGSMYLINNIKKLKGIKGYDELVAINRDLYEWALELPYRVEEDDYK